jgi:hypothetical protein
MSSKSKLSVVVLLAFIAISCSDSPTPKKGITRFYVTKITMPDGWEDQFEYANDTLVDQVKVYKSGQLLNTQKVIWSDDESFAIQARGNPLNEITSVRKFTFSGRAISDLMVHDYYPKYDYQYDFSFDSQSRLDTYTQSRVEINGQLETGKATWQTDSLSVLQTAGTKSKVFGIKFTNSGASPWAGLSLEALGTIMFQEISIVECFVPGKINTLGSPSYGYYKYDEYLYDADNNLTSLRRTNISTGKVEYFKFEWKKVLL